MNYLIAGLGNPGEKYTGTRHNIGFDIVDWLADEWRVNNFIESSQANALTSQTMVGGDKLFLAKPQTFMNNSGESVQKLVDYFNIPIENVLIIYDDADLPCGDLRINHDRGSGGHRGLQSVINRLGTKEFYRVRVGISPTDETGAVDKLSLGEKGINPFVMGQMQDDERQKLEAEYPALKQAIDHWKEGGGEAAMNFLN